jgi:uncharacterized protein YigA (DUF484 family)
MLEETRKRIAELEARIAKLQGAAKEQADAELKQLRDQLAREEEEEKARASRQSAPSKARYKVAGTDLRHDHRLYRIGSIVELTPAEAKRLGKVVEPVK